jgi:hypothetical protein
VNTEYFEVSCRVLFSLIHSLSLMWKFLNLYVVSLVLFMNERFLFFFSSCKHSFFSASGSVLSNTHSHDLLPNFHRRVWGEKHALRVFPLRFLHKTRTTPGYKRKCDVRRGFPRLSLNYSKYRRCDRANINVWKYIRYIRT